MGLEVEVVKAVRSSVGAAFVRRVLVAAAAVVRVDGAVTVRITGDRELRRLNRQFMGDDHATDVLSFPAGDGYLGDLAISWPAVERQALEHGHPVESELALLCVHGLLHLAGWDHASARDETEMWRVTRECLAAAGVSLAAGRLVSGGG